VHLEHVPGIAAGLATLPGSPTMWSPGYLGEVARRVDQVALMSYDTMVPTAVAYSGYVRRTTRAALAAVPADVGLLIGVPAYAEASGYHDPDAEHITAALRGVRLALTDTPAVGREFGVAIYVDFTVTPEDWEAYEAFWDT
jgi:spore germination protein YaaH